MFLENRVTRDRTVRIALGSLFFLENAFTFRVRPSISILWNCRRLIARKTKRLLENNVYNTRSQSWHVEGNGRWTKKTTGQRRRKFRIDAETPVSSTGPGGLETVSVNSLNTSKRRRRRECNITGISFVKSINVLRDSGRTCFCVPPAHQNTLGNRVTFRIRCRSIERCPIVVVRLARVDSALLKKKPRSDNSAWRATAERTTARETSVAYSNGSCTRFLRICSSETVGGTAALVYTIPYVVVTRLRDHYDCSRRPRAEKTRTNKREHTHSNGNARARIFTSKRTFTVWLSRSREMFDRRRRSPVYARTLRGTANETFSAPTDVSK